MGGGGDGWMVGLPRKFCGWVFLSAGSEWMGVFFFGCAKNGVKQEKRVVD